MAFDVEELIATAFPRTQEVQVCARGDLVDRHGDLVAQLGEAAQHGALAAGGEAEAIAEQIVAVEEEMASSTITFVISSVSRRQWADLLAKHPPRREDKGADHNPETFPPAALAACASNPPLTVDQAVRLSDVLPTGEWNKLWLAMVNLNVTPMPHPKLAAATELLQANGRSSTTSATGESPESSSLAGSGGPSPSTTTTTTDD